MNQVKPSAQVYIWNQLIATMPYIKSQYPTAKLFEWNEYALKRRIYNINWGIYNPCRGYRAESARREIQTVNSIERQVLLEKCPKIQGDSVTLVLAFHLDFYIIFKILKSTHRIIENPQKLKTILPKPQRVAFHNPKTLRDTLVCSKLRPDYEEERAIFICGRRNCDICNILLPGNEFKSTTTEKLFKINFHFHCNDECVVFLLTYKICRKQYVGSAITKFNKMPNWFLDKTCKKALT